MDLCRIVACWSSVGFPRRRGDGPSRSRSASSRRPFPPQARGWTAASRRGRPVVLVSPAGAGMDPTVTRTRSRPASFPRRRGDGPSTPTLQGGAAMFPPQARGWTCYRSRSRSQTAVSPAGAGMDPLPTVEARNGPGFPRRRGDGPFGDRQPEPRARFPPQARGWTRSETDQLLRLLVSPAGAGMDPHSQRQWVRSPRFPRRRGDGPVTST